MGGNQLYSHSGAHHMGRGGGLVAFETDQSAGEDDQASCCRYHLPDPRICNGCHSDTHHKTYCNNVVHTCLRRMVSFRVSVILLVD